MFGAQFHLCYLVVNKLLTQLNNQQIARSIQTLISTSLQTAQCEHAPMLSEFQKGVL